MADLTVEFIGIHHTVETSLTFGRAGDLCIDDANGYMHRISGEFARRSDNWWLINRGSANRLVVFSLAGKRTELPPGERAVLTGDRGAVSFVAGPSNYELTYMLDSGGGDTYRPPVDGTQTMKFGAELSDREIDFLVTFARPRILGTGETVTYETVAAVWGVSSKTVDNTLQGVRRKLKEHGVRSIDSQSSLISHLLAHGKITATHLRWADLDGEDGGPRSAKDAPRQETG